MNCFLGVAPAGRVHTPIVTGGGIPEDPAFWRDSVLLGNVKSAPRGTYRAIGANYAQRHLAEFCDRFNRRFDLAVCVRRPVIAAARTTPLCYRLATVAA